MQVIGGGFGRTGTKSLQTALQILGFDPCYHMTTVFETPEHVSFWEQAAQGQPVDWAGVLGSYQAGVDVPVSLFVKELLEVYPEGKVVLTVRDPERWYNSVHDTIYQLASLPRIMPKVFPSLGRFTRMTYVVVWDGFFEGRFLDRDFAIQKFNEHNEYIKQIVPPEQLLVFSVKEGWEPLCTFLGVPVPDEPFPHVNDGEEMRERLKDIQNIEKKIRQGIVAVLTLLISGLIWRKLKSGG